MNYCCKIPNSSTHSPGAGSNVAALPLPGGKACGSVCRRSQLRPQSVNPAVPKLQGGAGSDPAERSFAVLHLPALLVHSFRKQPISHDLHRSVARLVALQCFALVEPFRSTRRRCESLSSRHPRAPTHQHSARQQSRQQRHVPPPGLVPGGSGQLPARSMAMGRDLFSGV